MAKRNRRIKPKKPKARDKKAIAKPVVDKKGGNPKKNTRKKGVVRSALLDHRHHEMFGVLFVLAAALVLLSLASFNPNDPAFDATGGRSSNLIGLVGAYLADGLLAVFGLTAFLLVVGLGYAAAVAFTRGAVRVTLRKAIGYLALTIQATALGHILLTGEPILGHPPGGLLGEYAGGICVGLLSGIGSVVVLTAGTFVALIATTGFSVVRTVKLLASWLWLATLRLGKLLGWTGQRAGRLLKTFAASSGRWLRDQGQEFVEALRRQPAALATVPQVSEPHLSAVELPEIPIGGAFEDLPGSLSTATVEPAHPILAPPISCPPALGRREPVVVTTDPPTPVEPSAEPGSPFPRVGKKTFRDIQRKVEPEIVIPKAQEMVEDEGPRRKRIETKLPPSPDYKNFQLPSVDMLEAEEQKETEIDKDRLHEYARRLEKKLSDYGIKGQVTKIMPGPVVTMYEYAPGPGIKVAKIAGMAQDLALALEAMSVRIIAPIPGRAVVGIEVSNKKRQMVYAKEIIGHRSFSRQSSKLTMALGKNIEGAPYVADLNKMPHLLVAGATGTGKSVALNTIITSILYKATPEDVRFIMVDPKVLELSLYEGIPHLLLPVVTDPRKAQAALQWAVNEMERRIQILHGAGVRNLDSFNKKAAKQAAGLDDSLAPVKKKKILVIDKTAEKPEEEQVEVEVKADPVEEGQPEPEPRLEKMPHIVIVIDELADLMMTSGREVETNIARIAQKARAAGIHLIVATQRPSVNVITGLIKANLPARVSFRVSAKVDSRTILDTNGAESLLGNGDMLFHPPTSSQLVRVHGAFISEEEITKVVEHLKRQADPVYDESILASAEEEGDEDGLKDEEHQDEMYDVAVQIVAEMGQASTSMVQRKLRIGYNRAARLIERMEREGIVGPPDGSRPRKVLIQNHAP